MNSVLNAGFTGTAYWESKMKTYLRRLRCTAFGKPILNRMMCVAVLIISSCSGGRAATESGDWEKKVSELNWVAYFPTNADPRRGVEPSRVSIEADLVLLRKAKFTGLVTYGSSGIIGRELPAIAEAAGFRGLIVGVWDPKSAEEIATAKAAAKSMIVLGYCVGNEGLPGRYSMNELSASIQDLRETTGKPVTTAEQIEDYDNPELLRLGDWVFPTVHPYFHRQLDPGNAVRWTANAYARLKGKSDRFVLFKEVGLPTAGDPKENLTETNQDTYYAELAKTPVRFVYFEAFDLPWKNHLPVEPHWGLFRSDRSPKALGQRLIGKAVSATTSGPSPHTSGTIIRLRRCQFGKEPLCAERLHG